MRAVAEAALGAALRYDVPLEPVMLTLYEHAQGSLFVIEVEKAGKLIYSIDPSEEAKELARGYPHLAERWLEQAIRDIDEDARFVVDSAYNAAELAVRALVLLRGETPTKTHGGLITQFMRLYVTPGEVERAVGRGLHEALMLRNKPRCGTRTILTDREAEKAVKLAEEIPNILRSALEQGT